MIEFIIETDIVDGFPERRILVFDNDGKTDVYPMDHLSWNETLRLFGTIIQRVEKKKEAENANRTA